MDEKLEAQFHEEMKITYKKAGKEIRYWANRFNQKLAMIGALQTAKEMLKPTKELSPGLKRLAKAKRLDLSVEALITKKRWRELFTDEEILIAQQRLEEAKNYRLAKSSAKKG